MSIIGPPWVSECRSGGWLVNPRRRSHRIVVVFAGSTRFHTAR